jgi:tetratricopeptide (TPR) repeat protein
MNAASGGDTPDLRRTVHQAHALLERRRFGEAKAFATRGLRNFPDDPELQYITAFAEYSLDENDAAVQSVNRLLSQYPQHYGARSLRAHLHSAVKEFSQAERLWIELLRDYPEDADCFAAYADLMLRTLNLDKAARLSEEGLRHSPDHEGCLYVAALVDLIRGGAGRGADTTHLQRLLREHPEHVASSTALVVALSDRGDHRAAHRVAQELLRSEPDSTHALSLVRELRMQSHWSMLPLYPVQRWGWSAAIVITVVAIFGLRAMTGVLPDDTVNTLSYVWLGYVIYSWTWPHILRKLL